MGWIRHRRTASKSLAVLARELITQHERILNEREQQSEVDLLIAGYVVDVDGAGLTDDPSKVGRAMTPVRSPYRTVTRSARCNACVPPETWRVRPGGSS